MSEDCGCGSGRDQIFYSDHHKKEESLIDNKWILDNLDRKLLVNGPIHDIYGDIIGYITKNLEGNVIRIFKKNVKQILD
jgi:hypothetical protein